MDCYHFNFLIQKYNNNNNVEHLSIVVESIIYNCLIYS